MNKNLFKYLILVALILLLGGSFFVGSAKAESDLILETTKECDIQYSGDSCIAELKLTNNTDKILDGEAFLHIDYQGVCSNNKLRDFDGEGIEAQFSIADNSWLNFSDDWENGMTTVSGFSIPKGEIQSKLKIETAPSLCPGKYTFTLELKGTAEEKEYITPPVVIGGGGGGTPVSGLQIYRESASDINTNSVTITWQTTEKSTSRVIYSPEGSPHTLDMDSPPNYGYLFSTIEDSNKVTSHKVIINGLSASTTYYFRCVSHGSPLSISREHSFTTLESGSSQEIQLEETSQEEEEGMSYPKKVREIASQRGGISGRILAGGESQIEGEVGVKEAGQGEEGKEKGDEEVEESELEETDKGNKFLALLASSITDLAKTNPWLLFLLLIILVLVFIFVFIILRRRFKDRED